MAEFTPSGAVAFADLTEALIGQPLATTIDGQMVSAAMIMVRIDGGRVEISLPDELTPEQWAVQASALGAALSPPPGSSRLGSWHPDRPSRSAAPIRRPSRPEKGNRALMIPHFLGGNSAWLCANSDWSRRFDAAEATRSPRTCASEWLVASFLGFVRDHCFRSMLNHTELVLSAPATRSIRSPNQPVQPLRVVPKRAHQLFNPPRGSSEASCTPKPTPQGYGEVNPSRNRPPLGIGPRSGPRARPNLGRAQGLVDDHLGALSGGPPAKNELNQRPPSLHGRRHESL